MRDATREPLPKLPSRSSDSHKGTFGRVLIIGGSLGMGGAPALSGLAALRSGAGLTFVAVPDVIWPTVAAIEPSYLIVPLAGDSKGRIASAAQKVIAEQVEAATAVAIGPGLGRSSGLTQLVHDLYANCPRPLVLDADALNALAESPDRLAKRAGPRIVTPHPGEFGRLMGESTQTVNADRIGWATKFVERFAGDGTQPPLVLVFKGHGTITADRERYAINSTGNPGMATGGTGDVLTGVTVSLLAQGLSPFEAARLAVYVHGFAGDLVADELGQAGLIASDLPRAVAKALQRLANQTPKA
ncbi:MAG TPA: NAD(P)H-hydrate dehydratase [Pirellulales bacterium]